MRGQRALSVSITVALLSSVAAAAATRPSVLPAPDLASPGRQKGISSVLERCPTFSWGAVPSAGSFELVVYPLSGEYSLRDLGEPTLRRRPTVVPASNPTIQILLPGSARSWTPGAESCLAAGGSYAWMLRAVAKDGPGAWSGIRLFQVASGPSAAEVEQALEVLHRYVESELPESARMPAAGDPLAPRRPELADEVPSAPTRAERTSSDQHAYPEHHGEAGSAISAPAAPVLGAASMALDGQLHLAASSDIYRDGEVFLWTSGTSDSPGGSLGLGLHALEVSTGTNNTAIGHIALRSNTTGGHNTAVGEDVLANNTTGSDNTAVGEDALVNNTVGSQNTAIGRGALLFNVTGSENSALGSDALRRSTSGVFNTAMGRRALRDTTTGGFNTAVGADALLLNKTGFSNTAVGVSALAFHTSGSSNTAVGVDALARNETGSDNIALGRNAGNLTTGDENVLIGNRGFALENRTLRIGAGSGDGLALQRAFIDGIRGATGSFDQEVCTNSADQLGPCSSSSARFKDDIEAMGQASSAVHALRPVRFRYTKEFTGESAARPVHFGLIAEEVAEIYPDLVSYDGHGRPSTVRYSALTPLLLNELQEQRGELLELQRLVEHLRLFVAEGDATRRELRRRNRPRVGARTRPWGSAPATRRSAHHRPVAKTRSR